MQVKILQMTENPIDIMWTAARTCYSEKSPIEMWDNRYKDSYGEPDMDLSKKVFNKKQEKMWKLVKQVLDSGHEGIAEMVYFTFAVEGVSRALLAQLSRHRLISLCVQSQRYVEIKEDISLIEGKVFSPEDYEKEEEVIKVLDKYFVWNHDNYAQFFSLVQSLYCYLHQVRKGVKPEDARIVLPNATKTNLVMSCNLRELIHICNLRLCSRAQLEIRELFKEIKKQVTKQDERIGNLLVPNCEKDGFCKEAKSCGRKPKLSDILTSYNNDRLSKEDSKQLKEACLNPKENIKLKELLDN